MKHKPVHFTLCPNGSRHRLEWKSDPMYDTMLYGYCDDCLVTYEAVVQNKHLAEIALNVFKTLRFNNVELEKIILQKTRFFGKLLSKHKIDIRNKVLDKFIFPVSKEEESNVKVTISSKDIAECKLESHVHFNNLDHINSWLDILDSNVSSNIPNRTKSLLRKADSRTLLEVLEIFDYLTKVKHISFYNKQILEILHKINNYIESRLENSHTSTKEDIYQSSFDKLKDSITLDIALEGIKNLNR